ncbi:MAG: acyltransferase domain-containing protein [Gemmataceae bacterium]
MFPGRGSQYPNMLAQLALAFPTVRQAARPRRADVDRQARQAAAPVPLPGSAFSPEAKKSSASSTRADVAQPAIGACSLAMLHLLEEFGLSPRFVAGHSYGEFGLAAANALSEDEMLRLSHRRGEVIRSAEPPGGMVALDLDADKARALLQGLTGVSVANSNSPTQTVVAGEENGLQAVLDRCKAQGVRGQRLPVACAFHSPLIAAAREPLAEAIRGCTFHKPTRTVYSNTTAAPYGADAAKTLVEHLTSPVRFREQVEAMYAAGTRVFVEVGPRDVLTGLVRQTLAGCPHLAVASDVDAARRGAAPPAGATGHPWRRGAAGAFVPRAGRTRLRPQGPFADDRRGEAAAYGVGDQQCSQSPRRRAGAGAARSVSATGVDQDDETYPDDGSSQNAFASPGADDQRRRAHTNGNGNGKTRGAPAVADDAAQVMLRFQDLMAKFLDTKSVVTTFLQGGAHPAGEPGASAPVGCVCRCRAPADAPTAPPLPLPPGLTPPAHPR